MPRTSTLRTLVAASLVAVLVGSAAQAVGTRTFRLSQSGDFEGGKLDGVAVMATGGVRAGLRFTSLPLSDADTVWDAVALADGSVVVATGNEGKLVRVQGGAAKVVGSTGAMAATSLALLPDGSVVVGSLGDGTLRRLVGDKVESYATLEGADHVWDLVYDPKTKSVYAATGPSGKVFRIDASGRAQVHYDADEPHVMSLAVASDGSVYAGTSEAGRLYQVRAPGRATVVHDFERTEVRAIAVASDGSVYAIANELEAGGSTSSQGKRTTGAPPSPQRSSGTTRGKGVLYRFDTAGRPTELLEDKSEHFVSLSLDGERAFVGTGAEGRLLSVGADHQRVLESDLDSRGLSVVALAGTTKFALGSDPAVFHALSGRGGRDSVWTGKVLDAGLPATFGRMTFEATGPLEISTRTGNTKEPGASWSEWSTPIASGGLVPSPAGRFIQVRARWTTDPEATLREVEVPFVTANLPARITEVEVESAAQGPTKLETGLGESGSPFAKKDDAKIKLTWKVENPDKDQLRYEVHYQPVGTSDWFQATDPTKPYDKTTFTWESLTLPEGRYRLRVVVSDDLVNPPGTAQTSSFDTTVVLVDHTAPRLEGLRLEGRRLRGKAVDGVGPIARVEMAPVGSEWWQPLAPTDGVFDQATEEFDVDSSILLTAGRKAPLLVAVRAWDRAGNVVVEQVTLK